MHIALLVELASCPLQGLVIVLEIKIYFLRNCLGDAVDKMNIEPGKEVPPEKRAHVLLDTFHPGHALRQIPGDKIKIGCQVHV